MPAAVCRPRMCGWFSPPAPASVLLHVKVLALSHQQAPQYLAVGLGLSEVSDILRWGVDEIRELNGVRVELGEDEKAAVPLLEALDWGRHRMYCKG